MTCEELEARLAQLEAYVRDLFQASCAETQQRLAQLIRQRAIPENGADTISEAK